MPSHLTKNSRPATHGPVHLGDCDRFAALARKAKEFDALDRTLRQTLPMPLREHVRFASYRNSQLVFLARSSVWASRLRLHQKSILDMAHAIEVYTDSVVIKVAQLSYPIIELEPAKVLSAAASLHLRRAAASIADEGLRTQLLDLAAMADSDTKLSS